MRHLPNSRNSRALRPLLAALLTVAIAGVLAVVVGTGSAASKAGATPAAAQYQPTSKSPPTISGTAQDNQTLTANQGTWNNSPTSFSYRWFRCDAAGNNCAVITGATAVTYKVTSADVGRTIKVEVRAHNSEGSNPATSKQTAVVTAAPGGGSPPPSGGVVDVASVALPQRLIVDRVQFTPAKIRSRSEPLVGRFHVVDTRGLSVRNALVLAIGVPFDRLSAAPEVRTDDAGWATVTFTLKPTFALRPGNLVVVFVRARKDGDNPLAGVSTRRLVSVRVGR